MPKDFLANRQNVVAIDREQLNAKLQAIADQFDEGWLNAVGGHPLQKLWRRQDALSTNELLIFGDAVERFRRDSPAWLRGQVRNIKTGDEGQSAGALFEIVALNLFRQDSCRVEPARGAMPGFDGTLFLSDGTRIFVSIKNHGMSTPEREFRLQAKALDDDFQSQLRETNFNDLEVTVLAATPMSTRLFSDLNSDIANCLSKLSSNETPASVNNPYAILLRNLEEQYGPLSSFGLSSGCRVMAPIAVNEQKNFEDAIRKGCSNLSKHTKTDDPECYRMIVLRLSNTALISKCVEWANWYFTEFPDDPVDIILLYQCSVTTTGDASSITHFIQPIFGPRYLKREKRAGGSRLRLPTMSVFDGNVSTEQPAMRLFNGEGQSLDLSGYYVYQRVDAYQKVEVGENTMGNLSNPADGIMVHSVFEENGIPSFTVEAKAERYKALLLLP
ncbi:hypothetical protein [Neorhizobium sp. DAR64860/K0K1]|uniref:hypothetical protein n=1 Tax=Neorhizobium sp. DAR64860/K0K1 TaxID=3421955 RepID=UPI003D2A0DE2